MCDIVMKTKLNWNALIVLLHAASWLVNISAQTCGDPVTVPCPTAFQAAQTLTANSTLLPISNAQFTGVAACNATTNIVGLMIIKDFSPASGTNKCHYLAQTMPTGAVVLSNGNGAIAASVTNSAAGLSVQQSAVKPNDADATATSAASGYSQSLYDVNYLSFSITPSVSGPLTFSYVFGSEEYEQYAGPDSGYNDIFGFLIWKAGTTTKANVALLPNSTTPVGIRKVNQAAGYNTYYVSNTAKTLNTELNGMTKLLTTKEYNVTAGQQYNVKLLIADGGDTKYDSVVWIQAGSIAFKVDCQGAWVPWGACTASCGTGYNLSTFSISVNKSGNGVACEAAHGEVKNQTCNTQPCPINCVGAWDSWGSCNKTCGEGYQFRTYIVTTAAAYNGTACPYTNGTKQNQTCNTQACPVNCTGAWGAWGSCNATCGGGYQSATYNVTVAQIGSGAACEAAHGAVRYQQCGTQPCPINCVGTFGEWGGCSATCGGGYQYSTYIASAPAQYNGTACPYSQGYQKNQTCNTQACPVDCVGAWSDWDTCNATCGGGYQTSEFVVTTPARGGGANCTISNGTIQSQTCNTHFCPVDCVGAWSAWGGCNATCGGGYQYANYLVTTPASNGGTNCALAHGAEKNQTCNTHACPVSCVGSWVNSSSCNATCGNGYQETTFVVATPASGGGAACVAASGDNSIQTCNDQPCPGDCVGAWGAWDTCTATCDGGYQYATYSITTPAGGGAACAHSQGDVKNQTCNTHACPVNCVGAWGPWGSCNAACGGGNQVQLYTVTMPASNDGAACPALDGAIQSQACNTPACPVNCVGSWGAWGSCNQTCGTGYQYATYTVATPASNNGSECEAATGDLKNQTCNIQACPADCVGGWGPWGSCNATCGGGYEFSTYNVTVPAGGGGVNCPAADGEIRSHICNTRACPVNCIGAWTPWTECTLNLPSTCGSGTQWSEFLVTTPKDNGGADCEAAAGAVKSQACSIPCPGDCVGGWGAWDACNATCGGGYQFSEYIITLADAGGMDCEAANGTIKNQTCNDQACPLDCVGAWSYWDTCNATCGGGYQTSEYVITTPADNGGVECEAVHGTMRDQTCNEQACPVDCVGTWSVWGNCTKPCGEGIRCATFTVSVPASAGGAECEAADGAQKNESCNTAACPASPAPKPSPSPGPSITTPPAAPPSSLPNLPPFIWSPPVLPPISETVADSGIVIRGGNISISGVKIEASSGHQAAGGAAGSMSLDSMSGDANSTQVAPSSSSSNGTSSTSAVPPPKPRRAAFNGSLGFYTLGLKLEVTGDFVLQRSMAWTYNSSYDCYTTTVFMKGRFLLIRDEMVDNVVVSSSSLESSVSGSLTLFSSIYPGPGFSGTYDWAGDLELDPNPFAVWADAGKLLVNHSSNVSKHSAPVASSSSSSSSSSRALLQSSSSSSSSTGMIPVQGRVSVRESGSGVTNSGAGSNGVIPLDDEADIVMMGPIPAPSSPASSNSTGKVPTTPAPAPDQGAFQLPGWSVPDYTKLIIVLAAIVAPVAVALCSVCFAAGIIYRRRRKVDEEEQKRKQEDAKAGQDAATDNGEATSEPSLSVSGSDRTAIANSTLRQRWPSAAGGPGASTLGAGSIARDMAASTQAGNIGRSKRAKARPGKSRHQADATSAGTPSPAALEHSNFSSLTNNAAGQTVDGNATVSRIEFLDPCEFSGGSPSKDGGSLSLAAASGQDSEDLCASFEPGSGPVRAQGRLRSWAGSLAGMATTVTAALSGPFRSPQAAYRASPATKSRAESQANTAQASKAAAAHGSVDISLLFSGQPTAPATDMPTGQREPTLPGARAGSVILAPGAAAAVAQQLAATASSPAATGTPQQGAGSFNQQQQQKWPVKHSAPPHVMNDPAAWGLPVEEYVPCAAAAAAPADGAIPAGSIYSSAMYNALLRQQQHHAGSLRQPPTWS